MSVFDIIERLACQLVGVSRSAFSRRLQREGSADPGQVSRAWLRTYARCNARLGHWRAYVDPRNDSGLLNYKKIQRLYAEGGLRAAVKPLTILSMADEHNRECLGAIVDYSITGFDLAKQLNVLALVRGIAKNLHMDNPP